MVDSMGRVMCSSLVPLPGMGWRAASPQLMVHRQKTIGVFFEKEADDKRTASAGWYNTAAFERFAKQDGYYAKSINGDAYSAAIKQQTADLIKQDLKQIDLIIYSLASPRRQHPVTGDLYSSVLKPIGKTFTGKSVDAFALKSKR